MDFGRYFNKRIGVKLITGAVMALFVSLIGSSIVYAENPTANITITNQDGLTITFSCATSEDPDGKRIRECNWDITGPGISGTDTHNDVQELTYTFPEEGQYRVNLTVFDEDGESSAVATEPVTIDADRPAQLSGRILNPLGDISSIPEFLEALLDRIVKIAIPIIVVFIIYSGFLFLVAQGNPEKISKAKKTLMWTLIGAAVIIGADILAKVIVGTITDLGQ